jgi:hypothetical protein
MGQEPEQIVSDSTSPLLFNSSVQSSKSILSELNIDELFMLFPSVFEEFFYSNRHPLFKLNSIEQIENDLRQFCEQHFKLNLNGGAQVGNSSSQGGFHQHNFSIRI